MEKKILIIGGGMSAGRTIRHTAEIDSIHLILHENKEVKKRLKEVPVIPMVINTTPSKKVLKRIHKNEIKKGWKK